MTLEDFCVRLNELKLSNAERGLAVLWFHDSKEQGKQLSANTIAKVIYETGLGNPNATQLAKNIHSLRLAHKTKSGFKLKPTARETIQAWLTPILGGKDIEVELENGYLPEAIWKDTRGYIEKIAFQINGCVQCGFYDAASVLLRRLVETLLIECYEKENIQSRITSSDGHYLMLSGIIKDAVDRNALSLSRDTKKVLQELKIVGDRSAHNRRYNTVAADLENNRLGARLVVDELVQLAELKR